MKKWQNTTVSADTRLADAIVKVDAAGLQVALVLADDGRLLGILTDGDVRRAILTGQGLDVPVSRVMNPHPMTVPAETPRAELLALMRSALHHHLPLVDGTGRVVGLATLDDLIGARERDNWVVLMAGGLGTRLQPLTDACPKPMLHVGGKPILEAIVESFAEQGFRRIFLAVNYKAEMIRDYFGSGERWGVQLEYLHEQAPLGTAGALSLLPTRPAHPIIVMNGDLLTRTNFNSLLQFHTAANAIATMAVRDHRVQLPYGVVTLNGTRLASIEDKPVQRSLINAGIYALTPEALDYVPAGIPFDMPALFEQMIAAGKTAVAYPVREYWLDIGRLEEFERAQGDIHALFLS